MGRFDRQIATAKRLIAKNGQTVVWRVEDNGAANPETPWLPSETPPEEHEVSICFLPVGRVGKELLHYLRGTEVPTGSVIGLMGAVPFTPSAKDTVLRNGATLRINNIDELNPNGQAILYTIEFAE